MTLITLTTDFGGHDWFVGTMKGVIHGINPGAAVIDLCHEIPPGDIRAGAFALMAACAYFPAGTVHVAVIDPGVGSRRAPIAIATERFLFVGPDNGVLSWALRSNPVIAVQQLDNPRFFLPEPGRTFHGRDIFAPVAAHLSRQVPIEDLGFPLPDLVRLSWPEPVPLKNGIRGEIMYLDRFGNAVTNIPTPDPDDPRRRPQSVVFTRSPTDFMPIGTHYQSVPSGKPLGVFGSAGFLEISLNGDSAAKRLNLTVGEPVALLFAP